MPAYKYEALNDAGRATKGLIEADSARAARAQLRTQGLVPMELLPVQGGGGKSGGWSRRVFSTTGLSVWTRQLAGLVGSGLTIERALTALGDEAEDPKVAALLAQLRAEVNGGATFARALGTAPKEFDDVYRAVVAAGEASGALDQVLEKMADDLEQRQELRAKLIGAMAYPGIVTFFALGIVTFLLTYVVPQVASTFSKGKHALPWLTSTMMSISDFVRAWGLLMAGLALMGAIAFVFAMKRPAFRFKFDSTFLRLPLFGRLARGYNAARFAATLAMLAGAGVPILKALQAAAETLGNSAMRNDAMEALVQVREGAPIGAALAGKKRFPGLLAMFARLGEQTGALPEMLERAARQLGTEVQRRAIAMATMLEPLLIVAMGAIVMLIVLAVLLPIIQMNSWVK